MEDLQQKIKVLFGMKKKIISESIALIILFSGYAASQTAAILNEVVKTAIENNQQIKSSQLGIEKEKAAKLKAFNIPSPQLFTEYEGIKGSISNFESRKIGIIQELEFPTNYFLRKDVQSSQVQIAEEELNNLLNHLKKDVKTSYYNLLLQIKLLETAKNTFKIYEDFLFVAEKKYDAGATSNLEVLGARVNKIKIENEIKNMESEIKSTQSELKKLANVTYEIVPSEELSYREISLTKGELLEQALRNNPELKIIKYRKEKFSNIHSLSKGELLPDLSFKYYRQKIGDDNGYWGIELGVGIPLWFWGEQTGNIKESDYEIQIASSEEAGTKSILENELNKTFEEYENSLRQLRFFRDEAIKETDEIFRQSKISYDEGSIGYVEYLQSLTVVYDTRTQYLNSIYNYNKSIFNLEEIIAGDIK